MRDAREYNMLVFLMYSKHQFYNQSSIIKGYVDHLENNIIRIVNKNFL